MKKTFGKQAMRIMAAALVMVLLMVSMASGEQSAWDCPECGRTYVSGGTTSTAIAYPKDDGVKTSVRNPKEQENYDT